MGKRKIKWQSGDSFVVPLSDGTYGQGQVLLYEPDAMNSALCAFFSTRYKQIPTTLDNGSEDSLLAVVFATRDHLDSGRWHIVNNQRPIQWERFLDIRTARVKRHVGTKIYGSGIMADFLSAYHTLIPWDHYLDPEYFDKLLVAPNRKPANPLLK